MIVNCVFIGLHAGEDIIDADGVIIIGDDIRSVPAGAKIVIGETVFGKDCNLAEILRKHMGSETRDEA